MLFRGCLHHLLQHEAMRLDVRLPAVLPVTDSAAAEQGALPQADQPACVERDGHGCGLLESEHLGEPGAAEQPALRPPAAAIAALPPPPDATGPVRCASAPFPVSLMQLAGWQMEERAAERSWQRPWYAQTGQPCVARRTGVTRDQMPACTVRSGLCARYTSACRASMESATRCRVARSAQRLASKAAARC